MKSYYKIMQIFWLAIGIVIVLAVTLMGFVDGFDRWYPYYFLAFLSLFLYFIRRYMLKRMEKIEREKGNPPSSKKK